MALHIFLFLLSVNCHNLFWSSIFKTINIAGRVESIYNNSGGKRITVFLTYCFFFVDTKVKECHNFFALLLLSHDYVSAGTIVQIQTCWQTELEISFSYRIVEFSCIIRHKNKTRENIHKRERFKPFTYFMVKAFVCDYAANFCYLANSERTHIYAIILPPFSFFNFVAEVIVVVAATVTSLISIVVFACKSRIKYYHSSSNWICDNVNYSYYTQFIWENLT